LQLHKKQRLIGGLVVIALLVIFIPLLFPQKAGIKNAKVSMQMPKAPKLMVLPQPFLKTAPVTPIVTGKAKQAISKKDEVVLQSQLNNKMPTAWVLQLGVFAEQDHVVRLIKMLRQQGYTAYTRKLLDKKTGKQLTKIFIGPEIKLNRIKAIKTHLQQQMHIEGIVRKYTL